MPFSALKDFFRRQQLARAGIRVKLRIPLWQAGLRSGVWTVCPDYLNSDSIVYSIGVGDNIAWDLALIERFGVTVHAFDPTPGSIAWIDRQQLPERFRFHPVGVAEFDGIQYFRAPQRGNNCNYTPCSTGGTTAPVRRISTLAHQLGHRQIDLLKLDIEGGEYAVIPDLLANGPAVRQLLVEVHHHLPGKSFAQTDRLIRSLEASGYQLFHLSQRGLEFAFLFCEPVHHKVDPRREVLSNTAVAR